MKTIYFIRHAKSSWKDMSLRDFDRPLNKRGLRDAPFMANLLKEKGVEPDAIVSSPANRAYTTACYFAKALNIEVADIIKEKAIYEAYYSTVLAVVQKQSDQLDTLLVFGHNPAFTNLANSFTGNHIDNVPTCGIVEVAATINKWAELDEGNGKVVNFLYPKLYL